MGGPKRRRVFGGYIMKDHLAVALRPACAGHCYSLSTLLTSCAPRAGDPGPRVIQLQGGTKVGRRGAGGGGELGRS